MKEKIIKICFILVILLLIFGYPTYFFILNNSKDIKHETNRWAIANDIEGNLIAIEVSNSSLWEELQFDYELNLDSEICIIGLIIAYNNLWGFRLEPSTVHLESPYSRSSATILEIANSLDYYLSSQYGIKLYSMRFFENKYTGITVLIVDLTVSIITIALFSYYLVLENEKRKYKRIKKALLLSNENPDDTTIERLSQQVEFDRKYIIKTLIKKGLKDDLGLLISDEHIQFKDIVYKKVICQVEENLKNFQQLSQNPLTLEDYSKFLQFNKMIDEALVYYRQDVSKIEELNKINTMIEMITTLINNFSIDNIK